MSDMLERLLGVEKTATGLISEAEAEAGNRTGQARAGSQKATAAVLKEAAAAAEEAVGAERARCATERESKNAEYRSSLARKPSDAAAFRRAALSFMEKGGA